MLFHEPGQRAARPLTTICGLAIGILCGFTALRLTGLANGPLTMVEHVNLPRVICAALALGTTGTAMLLLGVWHPPAGATALIVSLGFITRPYHLLVVGAAVVALAWGINRFAKKWACTSDMDARVTLEFFRQFGRHHASQATPLNATTSSPWRGTFR